MPIVITSPFFVPPSALTISGASYDGASYALPISGNYTSLFFKPDGTRMYTFGNTHGGVFSDDGIRQYNLSTPWDLTTASYASKQINTNSDDAGGSLGMISGDGTKGYMCGPNFVTIFQYDITTPWEVSPFTAGGSFLISKAGREMVFNNDGSKMYFVDNGIIDEYDATGYEVTTFSFSSNSANVTAQTGTDASAIQFNSNGSKAWVMTRTSRTIYEYSMSTFWDISTLTYTGTSFVVPSGQGTNASGLWFKSDYKKFYVLSDFTDTVYQFSF